MNGAPTNMVSLTQHNIVSAEKELRFSARRRYEQGELRRAEEECRSRGETRAVSCRHADEKRRRA